jgi:hypothetical protein
MSLDGTLSGLAKPQKSAVAAATASQPVLTVEGSVSSTINRDSEVTLGSNQNGVVKAGRNL